MTSKVVPTQVQQRERVCVEYVVVCSPYRYIGGGEVHALRWQDSEDHT